MHTLGRYHKRQISVDQHLAVPVISVADFPFVQLKRYRISEDFLIFPEISSFIIPCIHTVIQNTFLSQTCLSQNCKVSRFLTRNPVIPLSIHSLILVRSSRGISPLIICGRDRYISIPLLTQSSRQTSMASAFRYIPCIPSLLYNASAVDFLHRKYKSEDFLLWRICFSSGIL